VVHRDDGGRSTGFYSGGASLVAIEMELGGVGGTGAHAHAVPGNLARPLPTPDADGVAIGEPPPRRIVGSEMKVSCGNDHPA